MKRDSVDTFYNLPAGYTANSADGSIVDNQYVPADACPGDCNSDGVVDASDFLALLANFGPSGGFGCSDFDQNGVVDASDFLAFLAAFGTCQ